MEAIREMLAGERGPEALSTCRQLMTKCACGALLILSWSLQGQRGMVGVQAVCGAMPVSEHFGAIQAGAGLTAALADIGPVQHSKAGVISDDRVWAFANTGTLRTEADYALKQSDDGAACRQAGLAVERELVSLPGRAGVYRFLDESDDRADAEHEGYFYVRVWPSNYRCVPPGVYDASRLQKLDSESWRDKPPLL